MNIDDASYLLGEMIQENIDNPSEKEISKIRSFWNNESWKDIQDKFQTEGSVWYVWWMDGVIKFLASRASDNS